MKKTIIIFTIILLASFDLRGQDTSIFWKDGAMYRTVTQYEKLLLVSDSTKLSDAKQVFFASKIPLYDTTYDVEIKSLREFFITQKRMHIRERGIRITDKKEYYENVSTVNQKEKFNVWLLVLAVLGIILLIQQKRYLKKIIDTNRMMSSFPLILTLGIYVGSALVVRAFIQKNMGPLFVNIFMIVLMSFLILLALLFLFFSFKSRTKE